MHSIWSWPWAIIDATMPETGVVLCWRARRVISLCWTGGRRASVWRSTFVKTFMKVLSSTTTRWWLCANSPTPSSTIIEALSFTSSPSLWESNTYPITSSWLYTTTKSWSTTILQPATSLLTTSPRTVTPAWVKTNQTQWSRWVRVRAWSNGGPPELVRLQFSCSWVQRSTMWHFTKGTCTPYPTNWRSGIRGCWNWWFSSLWVEGQRTSRFQIVVSSASITASKYNSSKTHM